MKEFDDGHRDFNDLGDKSGEYTKRTFDENAEPLECTELKKSKKTPFILKTSTVAAMATLGICITTTSIKASEESSAPVASEVESVVESESEEVSTSESQNDTVIVTVTDIASWVFNDNSVIFGWAWTPGSFGSWYNVDSISGNSVAITFPNQILGFNLVRAVEGTTSPDWNIGTGFEPGRITYQTLNITYVPGTTTYVDPGWIEYPNEYCPGCN